MVSGGFTPFTFPLLAAKSSSKAFFQTHNSPGVCVYVCVCVCVCVGGWACVSVSASYKGN